MFNSTAVQPLSRSDSSYRTLAGRIAIATLESHVGMVRREKKSKLQKGYTNGPTRKRLNYFR